MKKDLLISYGDEWWVGVLTNKLLMMELKLMLSVVMLDHPFLFVFSETTVGK